MIAVMAALALQAAPDGGIFDRCVEPPPGDQIEQIDGGQWILSDARARYDACRLGVGQKCAEQLQAAPGANQAPPSSPTVVDWLGALSGIAVVVLEIITLTKKH